METRLQAGRGIAEVVLAPEAGLDAGATAGPGWAAAHRGGHRGLYGKVSYGGTGWHAGALKTQGPRAVTHEGSPHSSATTAKGLEAAQGLFVFGWFPG